MNFFLRFNHIYLIPVWVILFFYTTPSMLGVFSSGNANAYSLFLLSILAVFSYFIGYKWFSIKEVQVAMKLFKNYQVNWEVWAWVALSIYFTVIGYACFKAPQIALFASFKGASIMDLSILREQFLRTGVGFERVPLYIYTICITSVIPLIIAQLFLTKKRTRFVILFLFILSLLLTLEKGRALVGMLPLIVLHANRGKLKKSYTILACLIVVIAITSILARGGLTNADGGNMPDKMASVPEKYNVFPGKTGQAYYLINRVIYIPYMTAIDWLDYKNQILNDRKMHGQSIGAVAKLMHLEKINLEREVFAFEWGQNMTGTGSANTAYYIDAYLNFGVIGVVLYSFLLAFIIKICVASNNKALICTLPIPLYYVCFHGLSVILFSGGLGIFMTIALFTVQKKHPQPGNNVVNNRFAFKEGDTV